MMYFGPEPMQREHFAKSPFFDNVIIRTFVNYGIA